MTKRLLSFFLLAALCLSAQVTNQAARRVQRGAALPATCAAGDVFEVTGSGPGLYHGLGSAPCVWTPLSGAGAAAAGWTKSGSTITADPGATVDIGTMVFSATAGVLVPITISTSGVVHSGTYTSGITATGSVGQTCALASLNGGGSSATATVALTGTNTIAAGTALVVTAVGSGYTSSPTSSTAGDGTAACSGTAVIATYLTVNPVTGFHFAHLTAGNAAYVLPAITSDTVSNQMCILNAVAKTGKLKLVAPASTYLGFYGVNGSSAGTLVSNGAAGDAMCVVAVTTTQYMAVPGAGIWIAD